MVLALDDSQHFRIEDLATGAILHTLTIAAIPGGPSIIASAPGGWIVTYTPESAPAWNQASSRLALVRPGGTVTAFGPTFSAPSPVSGIAVSPDDSRVAIALMSDSTASPLASIMTLPTPGHTAPSRKWPVDNPDVNELTSLSWAPDGHHLSYIAGSQTGDGISNDPATLDTASDATSAPTTSAWRTLKGSCAPNSAGWLGTTGRFATIVDCKPSDSFRYVDAVTGAPTGPPITLPNHGCLTSTIHPSADGTRALISQCDRVDLLANGTITELDSHLTDAAWAG